MPQEYSWEVRERAKELYVVDGLTFDQVAEATGVSVSQLKRWSAEEKEWESKRLAGGDARPTGDAPSEGKDWPEARKEFRLALGSIRRDSVLLRARLITGALDAGGEFKRVLAASMWEKTQNQGSGARGQGPVVADPAPPIESASDLPVIKTAQDAVAALEVVVAKRVNLMATRPELLSFNAIKDLQKTLGLIEELKTKYRPDEQTGQAPGLSDEAADEIRRQFLGVT
jgi:transposase-like protein